MKDTSKRIRQLLDARGMDTVLDEMAAKIARMHPDPSNMLILGMASRGIPLGKRLSERLMKMYGMKVDVGSIDATYYRDDFHFRKRMNNPVMRIAEMPADVEGKVIVLVDDVLFTGRSTRAAIEAIMDLGRPAAIRLCVMVDRGHRELPIAPDCVGLQVDTAQNQEVRVRIQPHDEETAVWLVEVEDNA